MWCWWPMTCESKGKPWCDWSDPDARSELMDGLVTDGLTLIEAVNNMELDPQQADAVGLLGVVTGQHVEPDPHREGRWRIARRVAKNRTISTVDPRSAARSQNPDPQTGRVQGSHSHRTPNRTGHCCDSHPCQHPRR